MKYYLIFLLLFLIPLSTAAVNIGEENGGLNIFYPTIAINYTEINTNNSLFLRGYTPATLPASDYITAQEPSYLATFNSTYANLNSSQWIASGANIYNRNWAGSVGIGDSTPSRHLDISNNSDVGIRLFAQNANFWDIVNDNAAGHLTFSRGSSNLLRIDNTGKVGIGTITPTHLLNVAGTSNFTGNIIAQNNLSVSQRVGIGTSTPTQSLHVVGNANITGDIITSQLKITGALANNGLDTCTLVLGSCLIANTRVTASTAIICTSQTDGGTPGFLRIGARVAGVSYTVTSSTTFDTSSIACLVVEPQ